MAASKDTSQDSKDFLTKNEILSALRAAKRGDFSCKLPDGFSGVDGDIAAAFNDIVFNTQTVTDEFIRVAKSVGTTGKFKDRAVYENLPGYWSRGLQAVNKLIDRLTLPLTEYNDAIKAVARGDLNISLDLEVEGQRRKGSFLQTAKLINSMIFDLRNFASEVSRVAREVGSEGKLGGQAKTQGLSGTWLDLTGNVNMMAANLTNQVRNIAEVTTSVANGDLSKKITVDAQGEILDLKNTINIMVDQLSAFASEVTRVAKAVGTEGILGEQAQVHGVSGTWKDLTDNVNTMANNLTSQVRNIAEVTTAVAKGNLTKKIDVEAKGEILELRNTINTMVDQLSSFADEVTRVAREVGTDGQLGVQAEVEDVSGTWKDLTDNVNTMANNLTSQVRNIAEVTTAVAKGDLTKKIDVEAKGEILELRNTINTMVDQLSSFADEVTRVAREVGTDGQLGGQAEVAGVSGTWKDLTDNVNTMADNLTSQVRNIADVTTAVANGDLSKRITVDAKGEILELRNTINTMVDQLSRFADEVTRVAREVGTGGQLGGQAEVVGVSGTWKDLTDNVNTMADNLTSQVRNIAEVTTAVANGDLTKKITVEASGEIMELRNTINTMVDQLSSFADEVTRVAREVGSEGKLGGQAEVEGGSGIWKDLTDNVNMMANNLTEQVRNIADVTTAVAEGDLSKKITVEAKGEILGLGNTINNMVDQLSSFAAEVTRVAREVGTDGKLGGQAEVEGVSGTWKDLTDNVNMMANNLTEQVRNIAEVTTAVANGDFSKKITVEVRGEILSLKATINIMVDQLSAFAAEVTRVAREVGTEGQLGGQAAVEGVSGTWKDLTDNVNTMANNLTNQVRGIAKVVTSVANGDLRSKLTLEAKGEIAELAETINEMTETLATFADQVTNVAREVGIEGKLGAQANVPGAAGIWRDLTDNVNELAANLTTQVRAIAEVATAVTDGDLTRSITAEARGEVAKLKDNINEMILNLKNTTTINEEQDWLKTNLAQFASMLQGQRDLIRVGNMILSELAPLVSAQHGVFYLAHQQEGKTRLKLLSSYAFKERKHLSNEYGLGQGLVGQCALEKQRILMTEVPNDYIQINSGLGSASPLNIVVLPVVFEGELQAVIELASFNRFPDISITFLDQLTENIGIMLNTISATMRTEELLKESQTMAEELQNQQDELRRTNEELEEKALELEKQKEEVEAKNTEVEKARQNLEEKAEELALTSKYKSEFLANMSHELRTPLNSQLILSNLLSENEEGNLSEKQVEYAQTIHTSGKELLSLISEILDLSKIESGTMAIDVTDVSFARIRDWAHKVFDEIAKDRQIDFNILISPALPATVQTDEKRLQQVLKNLLSNAFKFTEKGGVELSIDLAESGWNPEYVLLTSADTVYAFRVKDSGIGIAKDKQQVIFEAFQQADGTTSRKYGGTGLGLSITREIVRILGGQIIVESSPGRGSLFTVFLPGSFTGQKEVLPQAPQNKGLPGTPPAGVPQPADETAKERPEQKMPDDRQNILSSDRVVLIVEDDPVFARLLLEMARKRKFKGLVAHTGNDAIQLARQFRPDAITLDLNLPDMIGITVLDMLKRHTHTRHIPVHIVSVEEESALTYRMGAVSHVQKPITKEQLGKQFDMFEKSLDMKMRKLLLIEDDPVQQKSIKALIGNGDVKVHVSGTGKAALERLKKENFDCIVVDLGLPDMGGFELIRKISRTPKTQHVPIIVYTGKDLSKTEETELRKLSRSIIIKDVKAMDRLLDETAIFLHRVVEKLPEKKKAMIERLQLKDPVLSGRKVLIIDDDIRNIFALTAILENQNMSVIYAESGIDGVKQLKENSDTDIVLMDIMMPEMDGYEATRRIRQMDAFTELPIISLTAKAMRGDREKCIQAGASDYIAKPVEKEQLLSLLRVWLYR